MRETKRAPHPLIPNQLTRIYFTLNDVFHTVQRKHRLMVQIQSSWFPFIDRNPQTYIPNIFLAKPSDFVKATHQALEPYYPVSVRVTDQPLAGDILAAYDNATGPDPTPACLPQLTFQEAVLYCEFLTHSERTLPFEAQYSARRAAGDYLPIMDRHGIVLGGWVHVIAWFLLLGSAGTLGVFALCVAFPFGDCGQRTARRIAAEFRGYASGAVVMARIASLVPMPRAKRAIAPIRFNLTPV